MIWKTVIVVFLAGGVLSEFAMDEQHQQAREMLRQACRRHGAEDKVNEVEETVKGFVKCVTSLFDPAAIQKEIEEAKPNGALDEVFKKYCAQSPQLKTCIHSLMDGITPCVDAGIRSQIATTTKATDSMLDFICYKDGDRIALFTAEGGPECFSEKRNDIHRCGLKLKESVPSIDIAKNLNQTEQCALFDELSSCVVRALEGCAAPTPGNMAESLLLYVRNGSPCAETA